MGDSRVRPTVGGGGRPAPGRAARFPGGPPARRPLTRVPIPRPPRPGRPFRVPRLICRPASRAAAQPRGTAMIIPTGPFALLRREGRTRVEILTGSVETVERLADIPLDPAGPGTLAVVPYRQVRER